MDLHFGDPIPIGPLALSSDHATLATGKLSSLQVEIRKPGGEFVAPVETGRTEIGHGMYEVPGNISDTNTVGALHVWFTAAGCDAFVFPFNVVGPAPLASEDAGEALAALAIQQRQQTGVLTQIAQSLVALVMRDY